MKRRISMFFVVPVSLCLFLISSSPLPQTARWAWANRDSLVGRHGFYFNKRQWLADVRTVAAGIHFLYEFRNFESCPANVAAALPAPPPKALMFTNLPDVAWTASSSRANHRLSRCESLCVHSRLASVNEWPPMFAVVESSSNGLTRPRRADAEARCYAPLSGKGMLQQLPHRVAMPRADLRDIRPDSCAATVVGT